MSKKYIALSITMALLLSITLCSCENKDTDTMQSPDESASQSTDASLIFDGLALPENCANQLSGEITWPQSAFRYDTEMDWTASADSIAALLLGDGYSLNSDGTFEKDDFILSINDGSISFYSDEIKATALREAIPYDTRKYDNTIGYFDLGISKADYGSADLAFMPLQTVAGNVKTLLDKIGIKDCDLEQAYSMDHVTVAKDLNKFLDYETDNRDESQPDEEIYAIYDKMRTLTFTEDDECYMFVFSINVDGSPVMTSTSTSMEREIIGAEIYCLYGKDGLIDLRFRRVPTSAIPNGEVQALVTPQAAAEAILPKLYLNGIEIELFSVEFCYCYYNNNPFSLNPTWVFCAAREKPVYFDSHAEVTDYLYFAVDAISGEVVPDHL